MAESLCVSINKTDCSDFWQSQSLSSPLENKRPIARTQMFYVMLHSTETDVCFFRLSLQWIVRFL
jgi:hypothetical protein